MEYYYVNELTKAVVELSPEESRHCVKVVRHQAGDKIMMVDGKGGRARGRILDLHKDRCLVEVEELETLAADRSISLQIAVAPTKNRERIEWFVEKAVEIGIEKITFLLCDHSERLKIDMLRMERIAIAAMKQSQSTLLPDMEIRSFQELINEEKDTPRNKMIAWCEAGKEAVELAACDLPEKESLLLIGPEGDFSPREISQARRAGFREVKLGPRRLRTETAALYGCCVINAFSLQGGLVSGRS